MTHAAKQLNAYGPIEGILLLGGGALLRHLAMWAKSQALPIKVMTSPRHAQEVHDGTTLSDFLVQQQIEHVVVEELTAQSAGSFLANTKGYFYLSLGAAWIFKKEVIAVLFHDRIFNLHGTRLPQNRGGGGFSWQIMMGNRFGFCVLHQIDGGVDTGDIVATDEFIYPPAARIPSDYEAIYLSKNFDFITDFIKAHRAAPKPIKPIAQSEWFATYWPRLNTELNGFIDWKMSASDIERFICAFDAPYKGASTFLNDKKVFLKTVSLSAQDGSFHPFQSGLIYRKSKHWLCVAVNGATLIVEDIRDEKGNDLLSEVKIGDRLHTPQSFAQDAMARPIYTATGLKKD